MAGTLILTLTLTLNLTLALTLTPTLTLTLTSFDRLEAQIAELVSAADIVALYGKVP